MSVVVVKHHSEYMFMKQVQCNLVQSQGVNVFHYVILYTFLLHFWKWNRDHCQGDGRLWHQSCARLLDEAYTFFHFDTKQCSYGFWHKVGTTAGIAHDTVAKHWSSSSRHFVISRLPPPPPIFIYRHAGLKYCGLHRGRILQPHISDM